MMSEAPYYDPIQSDDPKKVEVPASKPKVAFEWPAGCRWPFADHDSDSET